MLRQLTGDSFQMEVISIVGMGGIGKSTFAKRMFFDPSVVNFFDVREWITVSKDYNLRNMLLSLLQDATGVKEEINPQDHGNDEVEIDNAEITDCLQKSFKGKRYLIVVDDIWSREAWDEIRLWFPENNNTSRILLTTRIMEVARYASYPKNPFPMRPLEPKESWDLFCQKAFGEKDCPTKFRTSGKVIVENCKGLPLILSMVAGTLSSKRTLDEVLALSYNYLPSHLKACFLYFGVFTKASEISMKKDLEEVADSLLHDLIDKSLVIVSKQSLDGKIKTCKIHDLLHDLCLIESDRLDHFKLLKSIKLGESEVDIFPSELSNLVTLRYSSTWKMSQLRHLHCRSIYFLSSPPNKYRVLENLRSVSGLNPSCCTKEIFEGIKKVKQLGICNFALNFSSDPNCLGNLRYLHELEALSIVSYLLPRTLPCPASFPPNLKKLTLCKTFLLWEDMAIISRLPKLKVLQLKAQAFECNDCNGETVWEITDMGFPVLKFFLLEWLDLEYWRATNDYFPCLEHIIIRNCHKLKEIP
ncbi:hypothetical protein H5410_039774 [Solanum commersonii]|uniref:NB-ARC domain-containing protein n=1 Tax=Solanum commersonii TaxID=4109 RepID=A0A9J5XPH5_SOLCO|nr:hypothetical protein H5410_039774 [Solanum commersonii]